MVKRILYRKKKAHRKRRIPRNPSVVTEGLQVADRTRCKLVYFGQKTFTAAGLVQSYQFNGNSLFDPDAAVGGNQPGGFDQWCGFYNRYRVLACKIQCTIVQLGSAAGNSCQLVLVPSDDSVTTAAQGTVVNSMNQYAQTRFTNTNAGSGGVVVLKSYMTTKRIMGIRTEAVDSENTLSALISGNPADVWAFVIQSYPLDGASTMNAILDVKLTYYAEMFSRKALAGS
jgi:hypothetical protein